MRITVAILVVTGTFGPMFCRAQLAPLPGRATQPHSPQTTAALPEFEAASIKRYKDSGGGGRTGEIGGGSPAFYARNGCQWPDWRYCQGGNFNDL